MVTEKQILAALSQIIPVDAAGLKLMSFAFLTGDGPTVLRGPLVSQYVQQLLHHVAWGDLDYLILDLPPGTGDIQLTISQSVRIDGAVIVTGCDSTLLNPHWGAGFSGQVSGVAH